MSIPPETERLRFRDWHSTDIGPFHSICSDPEVIQFVGDGVPWSLERVEQFVSTANEMFQRFGYCQWALIEKKSESLIGFCGFVPANHGAEIGWRLAQESWGRGLATEAARAAMKYGFETLGFERIIATVQLLNRGSIRVIEKLGMQTESSLFRNGREVMVSSMTHSAYRSITSQR